MDIRTTENNPSEFNHLSKCLNPKTKESFSDSSNYLLSETNYCGLKYFLLIILLVIYQFIGALIFYVCEAPNDRLLEHLWQLQLGENRTRLILQILQQVPKNFSSEKEIINVNIIKLLFFMTLFKVIVL